MNYNKLTHFLFLIIFLPVVSCSNDHTLKPEQYEKLGMPSYKKVWTNDEYVACNITLSSLKMNDPLSLPRKNSRKSGDLFNRIVNRHNLDFIHDEKMTLRLRAYSVQYFTRFQTEMEQMYTIEYKGKLYYSEELAELHMFGLYIHDRMLELAMIINKSDDPEVESIKGGMEAVKFNYFKLIPRLLEELAGADKYSEKERIRLASSISASVKGNTSWMNEAEKSSLKGELDRGAEKTASSEIKKIIGECASSLK
jgi:hypothetical protein